MYRTIDRRRFATGEGAGSGAGGDQSGAGDGKGKETPAGEGKVAEGDKGKGGEGAGDNKGTGDGKGTEGDKGKQKDGDGKGAEDGKGGKGSEGQGAPEKYELQLPEDGTLDARDQAAIEKFARANNLSNDDAQALIEEHAEQLRTQSAAWLEETSKDKTYGGDKLAETQKLARAAIAKIRPEAHPRAKAFNALLNKGGVFNHIEVVSFLADLGRMMGEDGGVSGKGGDGGKKKSLAEKLYDHPTSQQTGPED